MKKIICVFWIVLVILLSCTPDKPVSSDRLKLTDGKQITVTETILQDKIKGGWAGQVIGCTYGGPTEFRFNGTMIQDYQPIPWYDGYIKWWYDHAPGLYDDIYMDLTVGIPPDQALDSRQPVAVDRWCAFRFRATPGRLPARIRFGEHLFQPCPQFRVELLNIC